MPYIITQFLLKGECCDQKKLAQRTNMVYCEDKEELVQRLFDRLICEPPKLDKEIIEVWLDKIIESGRIRPKHKCICGESTFVDDVDEDFKDQDLWEPNDNDIILTDLIDEMIKDCQYICTLMVQEQRREIGILNQKEIGKYLTKLFTKYQNESRVFSDCDIAKIVSASGIWISLHKAKDEIKLLIESGRLHELKYKPKLIRITHL